METLEKELKDIGFSDDFVNKVIEMENFDSPDIDIVNVNYHSYENEFVSTTELEVTNIPTSYTNYVIGTESDE